MKALAVRFITFLCKKKKKKKKTLHILKAEATLVQF